MSKQVTRQQLADPHGHAWYEKNKERVFQAFLRWDKAHARSIKKLPVLQRSVWRCEECGAFAAFISQKKNPGKKQAPKLYKGAACAVGEDDKFVPNPAIREDCRITSPHLIKNLESLL